MRKDSKASTVLIFVGALLICVFAVGLICSRNPGAFHSSTRYDYTLESFLRLCVEWWIPAGIVGFPMFLISLILSLRREAKQNRNP